MSTIVPWPAPTAERSYGGMICLCWCGVDCVYNRTVAAPTAERTYGGMICLCWCGVDCVYNRTVACPYCRAVIWWHDMSLLVWSRLCLQSYRGLPLLPSGHMVA